MNSTEFLQALFADEISDQQQLSIFCLPGKTTRRFANIPDAVVFADQQAASQDVYFGLGLIAGNPKGRGKIEDIIGIGGLWADIDIANHEHKKKNLPPDIETAHKLLNKIPLSPSIIVSTGGGLHVYWVFKELWCFEDEAEKRQACSLSRRLAGTIVNAAAEAGYEVDSVGDLTRVLRLPGTQNHKYQPPFEIKVLEANNYRYTPYDFEDVLLADEFCSIDQAVEVQDVVLRADAEPPAMKFTALLENDPEFKRSWQRTRKNLRDSSASGYCLSLATKAANADWTDQDIADLVIAWRRIHNDDPAKALRWDWVRRTIVRARTDQKIDRISQDQAQNSKLEEQRIEKLAESIPQTKHSGERREIILRQISQVLDVKVARWIQHAQEKAQYALELGDGRVVRMGSTTDILNPRTFRAKLYEATHHLIRPLKGKTWDNICKLLAAVVELVENEETNSGYQAQQWVETYLQDHPPWSGDWQEGAYLNEPFNKDNMLCIHAQELRKHMRLVQGETRIQHVELCECLRLSGFTRKAISVWHDDKVVRRSYWTKPTKPNTVKEKKINEKRKSKKT